MATGQSGETTLLIWIREQASLLPVCGLDPVQRLVLEAHKHGLDEVVVVAPSAEHERLRARVTAHPKLPPAPRFVTAQEAVEAPEALVSAGRSQVLLALADRVVLPRVFQQMLAPLEPEQRVALQRCPADAAAGAAQHHGWPGLIRCRRSELAGCLAPLRNAAAGDEQLLDELGSLQGCASRPCPGGHRPLLAPADVAPAERLLLSSLVKAADGVISRNINRKISLTITRRLARTAVRPNHVTAVVLLLGLASGPLAAQGTYWTMAVGGLLYYLAAILDGCDGELSRLKYLGSPMGTWFDTITDDLSALSFLGGLYWGLSQQESALPWTLLGAVAVGGNLLAVLLRYVVLLRLGTGDHQKLSPPDQQAPETNLACVVGWFKRTIFRTDFLPFAAFVTAAAGVPWIFALPYPAGAAAAAVDSLLLMLRFGRRPADAAGATS